LRLDADAPLFLWPSRLYAQKGPELLAAIASASVRRHGLQIAMVASGDRSVEAVFRKLAATSDGRIAHRPFREELSMRALACGDVVVMPPDVEKQPGNGFVFRQPSAAALASAIADAVRFYREPEDVRSATLERVM